MFCTNCGKQIADDSSFCEKCGNKTSTSSRELNITKNFFYSKEWTKSGGFYFASIPHFDILIIQEYLYLIKFPKSYASTIGLIIGLFFSLIGAVLGVLIGISIEKNKRKEFRSRWINTNGQLTTNEYENNYYFKIPISDLNNNFVLNGKKIKLSYRGEMITLKGNGNEVDRLSQYIKKNIT